MFVFLLPLNSCSFFFHPASRAAELKLIIYCCVVDSDGVFLCSGLHLSSVYEVSQLCGGAVQTLWAVSWYRRPARSCGPHSVRCSDINITFVMTKSLTSWWKWQKFDVYIYVNALFREDLTMLRQEVQDLHASLKVQSSFWGELRCVNGRFIQRLFVCFNLIRRKDGSLESSRRS